MSIESDFVRIYKEYYQKIVDYLSRFVGPDDAEDLAQEVFDKINRNLGGFKGDSKISTWIYRIATNTAIDRLRSVPHKQSLIQTPLEEASNVDEPGDPISFRLPPTDQMVVRKEMSDCVNEFIDRLPLNYKTVLVLGDLVGLSYQEIADVLEISLHNVKIRLHRAREKLKMELKEGCDFYYNEEGVLACDRKQTGILPTMPK